MALDKKIDYSIEFDAVFKRHYHDILHYINSYLRDMEKSKNIAQDVFYKFWQYREAVDFSKTCLPYLVTIAKRLTLNELRKDNYKAAYSSYVKKKYTMSDFHLDALSDVSSSSIYTKEIECLLSEAMEKMPDHVREAFGMSRFRNLKNREIAEELGISQKTVEKRMSEALQVLRMTFKDYLPNWVIFIGYLYLYVLIK